MATSPERVRAAAIAARPLTETIFEALREAVVVIDARFNHLPLVLANATARRCLFGDADTRLVTERSLYSLLGVNADLAVEGALATLAVGTPSADRVMNWRFPSGDIAVSTELKLLRSMPSAQQAVMLTFADPSGERSLVAAVDQLPRDLLLLDPELTVTYANLGALRTSGSASDNLLGYSALSLVPTLAIPREVFAAALQGRGFHDDAVAVRMPGAPARVFSVDVQPLMNDTAIVGVTVLSIDVTERRHQMGSERMSDARFLTLTQNIRDIITVADRDGTVQYVSGGVMHALGYRPEERRSRSLFELVHPDDLDALRSKYADLIAGEVGAFSEQYRKRHKDGSYRWLESHFVSALQNPLIKAVVVNSRDVTRGKLAESRLAQREEVFRLAADAVNGVIFEWDLGRGIVHRSRDVHDLLGLEPDDIEAVGEWSERIHSLDRRGYNDKVTAALRCERGWTATYRILDAQGRYHSMLERAIVQRLPNGDPIRAIGCAVDMSESKRLTDLLGEIQRAALMGGWEYNHATQVLEWTDEMFAIYETTREEFPVSRGGMLARCTPESRERLREAMIEAESSSGSLNIEIEILTLKQHPVWVRVIGRVEMLDGRTLRSFGSMQNVTSQKLSQIALETSTEWLKLSMSMAHMHAWRWERSTDTLKFAIVDGQMMNLPRVFPCMKELMSRVHPQDRLAVRRAIDHAFEHHEEVQEEFRLKSRDGTYRSYSAVARPSFDAANHPSGLVGVTQDVTPRRRAEERLRRSEELLRATTANTADTLLLVDTELKVQFISRSVGGRGLGEIIGRDFGELLPEAARVSVIAKLQSVLATGKTATYEFEVEVPGGDNDYYENRAVLVRDGGIATGISIAVRDIADRRRLEREVLEVSSRERQRIGRDLHDGLGQELTGVALMLRGLAKRVKKDCPDSVNEINEIVGLVNQSIETVRSLARGLLQVNTGIGGLASAFQALAKRCAELYGLEVDFREDMAPDMAVSEANASHLYRIAQEALTNTARHGRAKSVSIALLLTATQFMLRIADDGVGPPAAADVGSGAGAGMGLKIMQYRASMIGAKLEIVPNHPHGTVVLVTCDQPLSMNTLQSAAAI
jgi:PAS domain S-box-containing protein